MFVTLYWIYLPVLTQAVTNYTVHCDIYEIFENCRVFQNYNLSNSEKLGIIKIILKKWCGYYKCATFSQMFHPCMCNDDGTGNAIVIVLYAYRHLHSNNTL